MEFIMAEEKKPCGCKNKQNGVPEAPTFRVEGNPEDGKNIIKKKLGMVQSFAMALTSRGLNNEKVNKPTKQLRVLSCFGNQQQGGVLPPCEHLKRSSTDGKFYCGGCGCGDKPMTWLSGTESGYSKLDYPKLNCPLSMPGFTNYEPSKPDEAIPPITRKYYIENINYNDVTSIAVTLPDKPDQNPKP
jgi:hypothetical protein